MRKIISLIVVMSLLSSLTGCFGGITLDEDQMLLIYDKDDGVTMSYMMEDKDLEEEMDIDFEDSIKDIKEDIEDYIDDEDMDAELLSFKKKDDYGLIEIYYEDADDLMGELDTSLADYADDMYGDFDDFAEDNEFVYFKNEDDVDEDDLEDYEDYILVSVFGGDEGAYYTFPSKIELVDEDVKFEKVDNNTIFIEDGEYGYVVIEEF